MNKRSNFSLNKLVLPGYNARKLRQALLETVYTDDTGVGILESRVDGDVVSGLLLKRTATLIDSYNAQTGELEKSQIFLFGEMRFYIDLKHSLLYSVGTATNLVQVRTFLKNRFDDVEFMASELSPYRVYNVFVERAMRFAVKEVCVDKFNFEGKAVGRFAAKIFDAEIVPELMSSYKEDISRIVLDIEQETDENFLMFVQGNNTIGISCDPDSVFENFETVKSIIF